MLPDLSIHRARTQFAEAVDSLQELEARLQSQRDAIDSRRALADARRYAREHRAEIDAEWEALPDGRPWTLADHIAGKKL